MADDTTMKSQTEMEKVEKTEKKDSSSVNFTELRDDLFREAAKLVSEDPSSRIAILIGPPRSQPNGPIQSFGYPSAQGVVQKFLKDTAPVPVPDDAEHEYDDEEEEDDEDQWPERWWEDEKILNLKDPEKLQAVMDEMKRLKNQLDMVKNPEQVKGMLEESSRLMNHLVGARETGQGSGNQEHLNNNKAGPKQP